MNVTLPIGGRNQISGGDDVIDIQVDGGVPISNFFENNFHSRFSVREGQPYTKERYVLRKLPKFGTPYYTLYAVYIQFGNRNFINCTYRFLFNPLLIYILF